MLPNESVSFRSIDAVIESDEAVNFPTEFLNSLDVPGLPPHLLQLKKGSSVMLLRNPNPPKLCNGTRMVVKNIMQHVLECTVMTGEAKGEHVFIPKIPLIPSDCAIPFKRLQFPLKLSYAMTINKSQGQTLKVVGLDLTDPVFSHGQIYVGCTRVGHQDNLFILSPDGKTKNVVYNEALQ